MSDLSLATPFSDEEYAKGKEPRIHFTTVRDSSTGSGIPCFDIECRFVDGQKWATIQVDGEFPALASLVSELLNRHAEARGAKEEL